MSKISQYELVTELDGSEHVPMVKDGTTVKVLHNMLPIVEPVNATPASLELTVTSRPDDYVANVQSKTVLTVVSNPNINVQASGIIEVTDIIEPETAEVAATGTIAVSGTPAEPVLAAKATGVITLTGLPTGDDTITIGSTIFEFKTTLSAPRDTGEILIGADVDDTLDNIETALGLDLPEFGVTVDDIADTVTIEYPTEGIKGNSCVFTEDANNVTVSGSGTLEGGLDYAAETLTVHTQEFIFVAARSGIGEITIDADNQTQAANIVTAITADLLAVKAIAHGTSVNIEAATPGEAGNSIVFTEAATGIAVSGSGTLEGGVDAIALSTLTVHDTTFNFVTTPVLDEDIAIAGTIQDQATNIKDAIDELLSDILTTGIDEEVVTLEVVNAEPFIGSNGNAILLSTTASNISVSGAGTLTNGVDADTLVLDTDTYTFVNTVSPGIEEILVGATPANTAVNIASILPPNTVTLTVDGTDVIVEAVASGVAGDGITTTCDGVRITGAAVTSGGVDEVKSYITINDINYIFGSTTGDDPSKEHPDDMVILTAGAASMADIAAAIVDEVKRDTTFNDDVSNVDEVVTINYGTRGIIGNSMSYVNNLVVAGDITDNSVDGLFVAGVDGTPAYEGQITYTNSALYVCTSTDLTTENNNWKTVALTDIT